MTANMEIPSRYPSTRGLPSIYIDGGHPSRSFGSLSRPGAFSSRFSPTLSTIPMSIPGSVSPDEPGAPPPLPPPKYIPRLIDDPSPFPEFHSDQRRDVSGPVVGSLHGSLSAGLSDGPNYKNRDSSRAMATERDEGYASISSTRSRESLPSGFGMSHDRFQFRGTGDSYDRSFDSSMLDRLNTRRAMENRSPPRRSGFGSSPMADSAPVRNSDRGHPPLQPLSLPTRTKQPSIVDSPNRFTETPLSSAMSPRSTPFGHAMDYRSPSSNEAGDLERSPGPRSGRTNSLSMHEDAAAATPGTMYEMGSEDADFPMEETTRLRHIQLEERSEGQTVGQKRRASSPPGDEPPPPLASELLRRREGGPTSRGSPTPRLRVVPQSSVSSISSAGRSGSYTAMTTSSLTSMSSSSFGRRSPGGLSAGGLSPTEPTSCGSPFAIPMSLATSPRSTLSRTAVTSQQQQPPPQPQRAMSDHQQMTHAAALPTRTAMITPRKLTDIPPKTGGVAKLQGFLMCECCPKKPKKFESGEELRAHEAEKQYECSFCGNRFKNKNEAERHQNSLHVRRHSWSCSALTGYERAFHESTTRPGDADACGYCGQEFARTGPAPGGGPRLIAEQDWEERVHHLQDTHKFRECNAGKKFYRADHFRQHLKHSHAGTSGKWTNMLENACMLEEDPPLPR